MLKVFNSRSVLSPLVASLVLNKPLNEIVKAIVNAEIATNIYGEVNLTEVRDYFLYKKFGERNVY